MLLTAFDLLLMGVSFVLLFAGLARLRCTWLMGQAEDRSGDWKGLLAYLLGHRKILEKRGVGVAHLALLWGVFFYLMIALLAQFSLVTPLLLARVLSLIGDVLGVAMLGGLFFFLIRRMRSTVPQSPKRVLLPVTVLLLIVLSGFFAEGGRLNLVEYQPIWFAPAGWLFSKFSPQSPLFMQATIRIHFFGVLLFLAIIPFTFIRHLITGSLNVYYRKHGPVGALRRIDLERSPLGARFVDDFTWKQLLDAQACVSCGRCDDHCPALLSGKPLSPRKVVQDIRGEMEKRVPAPLSEVITADVLWACTTCMACVEKCPVFVEPMDKLMEMRRNQVMGGGLLPEEARGMVRNLEIYGDVNGKGVAHREDWALNLGVPHIGELGLHPEILLWVGCAGAFHPRAQETTRAMVRILQTAQARFGILGKEELCCGDSARRMGDEERFLDLARKNIVTLKKYQVQRIVCLCPHGFNTLKNEYPSLGGEFEVIHAAEFVMELIDRKRIEPKYGAGKTIAIHDPCYLGRANRIYEPLRALCHAVPGVNLKELRRNRENAFCCGGGGGRMWLHESLGQKVNHLRAQEVEEAGVDVVGTSCPYCLTMLEDGINALEMGKPPKALDIIEIVASSLGRVY
jgi:Fe-S oxidoreductase/nitrate reductase gamma subunit